MTFDDFLNLARNTFRDPQLALRQLQSLRLPVAARWMALVALVSLSAIMATIAVRIFPIAVDGGLGLPHLTPISRALLQLMGLVLTAWLITAVGRAFGGHGDFPDALLVVVWLETLLFVAQTAQLVVMLLFPFFASLLGIVAVVTVLWATVRMVKALHGFQNTALVLLVMLGTTMLMVIFLSVMAGALGLLPEITAEVQ